MKYGRVVGFKTVRLYSLGVRKLAALKAVHNKEFIFYSGSAL